MILLMGAAGSGKSTQGHQLADEYGYAYISTGEVFRVLITGRRRNELLEGKLMSDDEVINVVDKILELIDTKEQFILDGFPRTQPQVDWLLAQHRAGRFELPAVINLEISEDEVRNRLHKRGRFDDTEESIRYRYQLYQDTTRPLLDYLKRNGVSITEVDANRDQEAVHQDILRALGIGVGIGTGGA